MHQRRYYGNPYFDTLAGPQVAMVIKLLGDLPRAVAKAERPLHKRGQTVADVGRHLARARANATRAAAALE